jgi:hypothetical protein
MGGFMDDKTGPSRAYTLITEVLKNNDIPLLEAMSAMCALLSALLAHEETDAALEVVVRGLRESVALLRKACVSK